VILTIRTDNPVAEIGLWADGKKAELYRWEAGRQLSTQLLDQVEQFLDRNNAEFNDLVGLIVFKGPGSFTGLRIGATVANTISYSLDIPIVGTEGDNWQVEGTKRLKKGENDKQVVPEYGAPANTTKPKK
jgi:tRNA threonylcarbamoyladenosine biosynthesis protein TsaB